MMYLLGITGMIGLIGGILVAAIAETIPAHRDALRRWGSGVFVGSAALLGLAFPMI